ncbi:MAG: Ig-like domain-containing protein [Bacteroides sp.]|nr:Ig-like domain-containing protein [Eubacterium sp.]MCM1419051.1 Ig-like domain-containing protein [Roseburia sp.]MCM1461762.1 Ig-like domain-containing protein [Bacteroides sp.]
MKLKKLIAVALAAVMTATALMIPAAADSIADTAKSKTSGSSFSIKLADGKNHDYKVKLTKSGDLKINLTSAVATTNIYVYDTDGNSLLPTASACKDTTGNSWQNSFSKYTYCNWNNTMEKYKGLITYTDLDKGTYYIRINRGAYTSYSGQGKVTLKFTFPGETEDSDDADGEITMLEIALDKGDSLALSAVMSGDGSVKWSSSDEAVATVSSKGKVTAKAKGTATITAKSGSSSQKIRVKVG